LGSEALHGAPPPVQAAGGMLTTGVCAAVLTVWVPEQAEPKEAPPQVYFNAPELICGPPAGAKSELAWSVMVPPLIPGVVRAR